MNQHTAWSDDFSRRLIHYAAGSAPESLSERLEEEWLSDMAARASGGSRLRFAIGCCWATRVIAFEYQPSVRVAGAVMEAKLALGNAHDSLSYFSRRSSTFFLVVALHVALFYVLMTKLSHTQTSLPPPPLVVHDVQQVTPKEFPPPPNPKIDAPVIKVEPPEVIGTYEGRNGDVLTGLVEAPPLPPVHEIPPTPPAQIVKRLPGGPGAGFPSAEDFYPDSAKRLGEQGSATVQVCVDAKGRLTSDPTTVQGTGSERLDQGALKLAKAGSGHYRASTEDGQPVNSCYPFRIRFQLKN